jgi:hypothetical protein
MDLFGLGAGFAACFGVAALFTTIFWLWMLVECAMKEPSQGSDKIVWILVILLLNLLGAIIYFLVRRPERIRVVGE